MAELDSIQDQFGVRFRDERLLKQALTHRSFSQSNNERLEFLGDSVLNLGVAAILYERYPGLTEGDLSRVRSNLVKQQALVEIANQLNLSQYMQLGDGEMKSGGMRRPSILADTLEALLGAIYLDQGAVTAQTVVAKLYERVLKSVDPNTLGKDAKTLLQEHLQGLKFSLPSYSVVATHGAAHNQVFEVECVVTKLNIQAIGSGGSRRAAEQAAATKALELALAASPSAPKRTRTKIATASVKASKELTKESART